MKYLIRSKVSVMQQNINCSYEGGQIVNKDEVKVEVDEDTWFKIKYLNKIIASRQSKTFLKIAYDFTYGLVIIVCFMGAGVLAVRNNTLISLIGLFACIVIGSSLLSSISVDADWQKTFEEYIGLKKRKIKKGGRS